MAEAFVDKQQGLTGETDILVIGYVGISMTTFTWFLRICHTMWSVKGFALLSERI